MLELIHWLTLVSGTLISYIYFRDLGDITQALLNVKRKNMLFAIRHENHLLGTSVALIVAAAILHYQSGTGIDWLFEILIAANVIMLGFPWIWIHVGLRNQQNHARYYSVEEAKKQVRPEESVIVIENNGQARAHPDYHIKRPHLAGTPEGLGGENVIMTYCCMTHLGLGYKPEIDGKNLKLEVLAQHGNNLIMKDLTTGEPIQQMYGTRECDGRDSQGMQPWPTFRMTFRGFERAFPDGEVFLNPIKGFWENPLLFFFDNLVEMIFLWGTVPHHNNEKLLFDTMSFEDDRLPRKTLVWGFTVNGEAMAYTEDFIRENQSLVNSTVGGRNIVVAYDGCYESIGIFYNDNHQPVTTVDFWGNSDLGKLRRVETVNAAAYWFVWVNYFSETELNSIFMAESIRVA